MLTFNLPLLIRLFFRSLFRTKNTHFQLTTKRIRILIGFVVITPFLFITSWIGFFLDHIFFPGFRKTQIKRPVFIIGNFRSGSTFLHRILALDTINFSCFKTWEIYLAPSICQRKVARGFLMIDSLFGSPFRKFADKFERKNLSTIRLHKVGLRQPEEDEGLFLYIWRCIFIWFFFPDYKNARPYHFFDTSFSLSLRRSVMRFYKKMLQRHMYSNTGAFYFLSKNPSFTPKIRSLADTFPDAKFIYLVRDPVATFTSAVSWFNFGFSFFCSPLEKYPFQDEIIDMIKHWYNYPIEAFKRLPNKNTIYIKYDALVKDPKTTIQKIYRKFSLPMSGFFRNILDHEAEEAKLFKSTRKTTPDEIGMSRKTLKKKFHDIYKHYKFDIHE
ncbi:MAG: sulfotransferase [Spirochaetales bacterium]|nr:sulfotransferase [Spirochaetales bacterium]